MEGHHSNLSVKVKTDASRKAQTRRTVSALRFRRVDLSLEEKPKEFATALDEHSLWLLSPLGYGRSPTKFHLPCFHRDKHSMPEIPSNM
jgi:hypothetical protein